MSPPMRPGEYRAPSVASRAGVGSLVAFLLTLGYVVAPWLLLSLLETVGIRPPLDPGTLLFAGIVLTVLGTAQYLLKPTPAFGPVEITYSAALLVYLGWLATRSPFALDYQGAALSLGYSGLLVAAMVVPALSLLSGIVTTLEDALHPEERLPFDLPMPSGRR